VYWSATGGSVTVRNGRALINNNGINLLKTAGELSSNIAILGYSIPISAQAAKEFGLLFQQAGVSICYENEGIPPAPGTVMGSVVQAMVSKGCTGVFTTMDAVGNADMLRDLAPYRSQFKLVDTTYEGYSADQIALAGVDNAQGLTVGLSSVPLDDPNPAVHAYQSQLATYQPGKSPSEFGLESWADAQLFVYALIQSGRNPTRASLISALSAVKDWTTGGAFGPYTPSERTAPHCSVNVQVKGNGFVRIAPASGLYCVGQLVDVGPAG
ncbi:MAG: ABC transporter substrate-binding protein, partial [Acidimicrobiales bacterium]